MDGRLVELLAQLQSELTQGLPGLAALIAVTMLFALVGAALSRDRTLILMTLRGWAITAALAIALPLIGIRNLSAILIPLGLLALLGAFALFRKGVDRYALIPSLVVGAPLLLLGCTVPSTFTDAYTQWLPNAQYLVQLGHLIDAPLPPGFYSSHPGYPPALALPVWISSQLLGEFAIGTTRAQTALLVVLCMPLMARLVRATLERDTLVNAQVPATPWIETLLAFMAVVLLNPGAHGFHYYPVLYGVEFWSAIADPPLSILVLVTMLVLVMALSNGLRSTTPPKLDAVTLCSLGALAAAMKSGGEYLIAVIAIAAVLVTVFARLPLRPTMNAIAWLGLGAGAFAMLWHLYGLRFQPLQDLAVSTLADWRLDRSLPLLRAFATIIRQHLLFHLFVLAALLIGIRAVLMHRSKASAIELLLALSSVAFAGHVATLIVAYLSVEELDIRAYSWQRYASQVGLTVCAATILVAFSWAARIVRGRPASSEAARPSLRKTAALLPVAAAAIAYIPVLISAVGTLRLYSKERSETHRRAVAALKALPPNARFAVAGRDWSVIYVRYAQWADMDASTRPWRIASSILFESPEAVQATREEVLAWSEDPSIDCILLIDAASLSDSLGLGPSADHLRCGDTWQAIDLDSDRNRRVTPPISLHAN
jgi:hypothetical protein